MPQFQVLVTERDGKKQKVTIPQLCLFKSNRLDCHEQATCQHSYCGDHCWVRACKAKRQRVDHSVAPRADLPADEDGPPAADPEPLMDSSVDGKAQAMAGARDPPPPELKADSLLHLTDSRPEFDLSSQEALYIAWLNGLRLVTARQSGDTVSMILPCQNGSLAVGLKFASPVPLNVDC